MANSYEFNPQYFPKISVHLLIESIALNQAILQVLLDKMYGEQECNKLLDEINSIVPELKETILEKLYESFGKTLLI